MGKALESNRLTGKSAVWFGTSLGEEIVARGTRRTTLYERAFETVLYRTPSLCSLEKRNEHRFLTPLKYSEYFVPITNYSGVRIILIFHKDSVDVIFDVMRKEIRRV